MSKVKILAFLEPDHVPSGGTTLNIESFPHNVIDKETGDSELGDIQVSITDKKKVWWNKLMNDKSGRDITGREIIKFLFEYANRYLQDKIKNGTWESFDKLYVDGSENELPFDLSSIKEPEGATFEIEIPKRKIGFHM